MKQATQKRKVSKRAMRLLPKVMLHEHLDCSLRPYTMLELWEEIGFSKAKTAFPQDVMEPWLEAASGNKHSAAARKKLRAQASERYQKFLVTFASQSLANYVQAIVDHILPLMQTEKNLARITRERIEDAVADGIIGMELRFAPQLHTWSGLSLEQVMDAVVGQVKRSSLPLKLIVCALRHEDGAMARQLADIAIEYRRHVGVFDLAADERANPGVLRWWLVAALYVCALVPQMRATVHLWETDEPTSEDLALLHAFDTLLEKLGKKPASLPAGSLEHRDSVWQMATELVEQYLSSEFDTVAANLVDAGEGLLRLGHGFRGQVQGARVLEVCPTSNVVTGQVSSIASHPIDALLRAGKKVTVNTDGTLFTEVQLTDEYLALQEAFGWTLADFEQVNLTAVEASSFSKSKKAELRRKIKRAYD